MKLNFNDTAIAFSAKSNKELKKMAWLFKWMNKPTLVKIGSNLLLLAIRLRLPLVKTIVRKTIFEHFCGGRTLLETKDAVDRLYEYGVLSILDYGVEAKEGEKAFNKTMNEIIRAIDFAHSSPSVPAVSVKITGLARFSFLEKLQGDQVLNKEERKEYKSILKRIDAICHAGDQKGVKVLIDAEESWIQDPIDHIVTVMMRRYNRGKVIVYNTFQMYRKDRLQFLIDSYNLAQKGKYLLGAKLVRGAYMEKERDRAQNLGYSSPIHESKAAVDDSYNTAIRFCVDNYEKLALINASHNEQSNLLQAQLIEERSITTHHPHLNFCQLYGMSDNLTFNLAEAGYNTAKYLPYGPVKEVIPYLVRRAQENTAVTGDVSREFGMIKEEMKRRGI